MNNMNREMHHEVTVTQQPAPEDESNGVANIIRAFIRNPAAAVEVIMFIGGGFGVYYALNRGIDEAKATSEQHYRDLTAQFTSSTRDLAIQIASSQKELQAQLTVLAASDAAEVADIKSLYARSDVRYREILDKLNSHDINYTKMSASLDYIAKQVEEGRMTYQPHPRGMDAQPR